ncbi:MULTISPECIES: shikimate kinase [unclassified Rothia (in: high G+C Gram-positive bacteria)]|uniref:shikimate kinase n=1 Tax=unclassified Rothia (in: high G+C Gram-positive bacteria) TaxID=2689056 RepID=UPI001956DF74|nr:MULTISPECIES: shikimate kinase [unclassified Rothia (in: high G+C Gram-positive bacteria)]MBM7050494.1 shikimate kinase [Rothia sp. ZJ1223]QRZ62471.1 shikimate kinase [Rothia sp. ZJ932]
MTSPARRSRADFIDPQQVRELQEEFADRHRPIVIIGPMAAGKSYIGMHLARFYGYEFIDSDQVLVERYGAVPDIFKKYGEAGFRQREAEIIREILENPAHRNTVLSLGGGAVMTPAVAELLAHETVIYISIDVATVAPRIVGNKNRPLLQPNPVEKWQEIFAARRGRYESLASFTLNASGSQTITDMTAQIQQFVLSTRKANS